MIFGLWSQAELSDLVKAKDAEFANIEKNLATFGANWAMTDGAVFKDWTTDYETVKARYAKAKQDASAALHDTLTDGKSSVTPADGDYKAILAALSPVEHMVTKGSFQDVFDRLARAMRDFGTPMPTYNVPQPAKGSDADVNVLQAADKAAKALDKIGSLATNKWVLGGIAASVGLILVSFIRR